MMVTAVEIVISKASKQAMNLNILFFIFILTFCLTADTVHDFGVDSCDEEPYLLEEGHYQNYQAEDKEHTYNGKNHADDCFCERILVASLHTEYHQQHAPPKTNHRNSVGPDAFIESDEVGKEGGDEVADNVGH